MIIDIEHKEIFWETHILHSRGKVGHNFTTLDLNFSAKFPLLCAAMNIVIGNNFISRYCSQEEIYVVELFARTQFWGLNGVKWDFILSPYQPSWNRMKQTQM